MKPLAHIESSGCSLNLQAPEEKFLSFSYSTWIEELKEKLDLIILSL